MEKVLIDIFTRIVNNLDALLIVLILTERSNSDLFYAMKNS